MTNEPQNFEELVISELSDIKDYFDTISKALVSIQDMLNKMVKIK
jgi:hypothetical protein